MYRATQQRMGRAVAVKVPAPGLSADPSFAERFVREAAIMLDLQEDDAEEALAYNGLTVAQMLIPCRPNTGTIPMIAAMAEGTQLRGSMTRAGAAFTVAGRSTDGLYEFRIETGTLRPTC